MHRRVAAVSRPNARITAAGLSAIGVVAAACASTDPDREPAEHSAPVAWSDVVAAKQQFALSDYADATAVREYQRLLARYWGLDPRAERITLEATLSRAHGIRPAQ